MCLRTALTEPPLSRDSDRQRRVRERKHVINWKIVWVPGSHQAQATSMSPVALCSLCTAPDHALKLARDLE